MRRQLAEDLIISNEKACGCGAAPTLREIVVVVPAHNDRDRLPRCLASIAAAAAHVAVPVDVMVVLDSCTDGSESMISAGVRRIEVSARNVGAARAAGFMAAPPGSDAQTWLATTDADSIVPSTWLRNQVSTTARWTMGW